MGSNVELIGAGRLADALTTQKVSADFPNPFPQGEPIGQHLRVERLVRLTPNRMIYLVNNIDPLWSKRMCWACGNRYSPNQAQSCTLCGTPLRDQRFLLSARWHSEEFALFHSAHRLAFNQLGVVRPVLIMERDNQLLSVYAYNGERLMCDEPSPLTSPELLIVAHRLGSLLSAYHQNGMVLKDFSASQVMRMPDDSAAWFDVDFSMVNNAGLQVPARIPGVQRDVKNLCQILASMCNAENNGLMSFLLSGTMGAFHTPEEFCEAVERALDAYSGYPDSGTVAGFTDLGLLRDLNEDYWTWRRLTSRVMLYVVADGMGGHDGGEIASSLACETVVAALERQARTEDPKELAKALERAVIEANEEVTKDGKKRGASLGTTLVAALIVGNQLIVAHAGDSRAYLMRKGILSALTNDHSLVALWVERGKITEEEARVHPKANVLHNHLGQEDEVEVDVSTHALEAGDRLLLCSDGLWGEVLDHEIQEVLFRYPKPKDCVRKLVRIAYGHGGADNITVVIIDVPKEE